MRYGSESNPLHFGAEPDQWSDAGFSFSFSFTLQKSILRHFVNFSGNNTKILRKEILHIFFAAWLNLRGLLGLDGAMCSTESYSFLAFIFGEKHQILKCVIMCFSKRWFVCLVCVIIEQQRGAEKWFETNILFNNDASIILVFKYICGSSSVCSTSWIHTKSKWQKTFSMKVKNKPKIKIRK